jgi:hypothetical protein
MPPPGLLRLGGELFQCGVDVALDDLAYRLAAKQLEPGDAMCASAAEHLLGRGDFDVLGLSTMGATLPAALEIARHYRAARPDVPIWLGGPGTGGIDVPVLERFPWVDAVVRGEGEITTTEMLVARKVREGFEGIPGVTWRAADGTVVRNEDRKPLHDLDEVADCAWHLLPPLTDYKAITGEAEGLTPIDSGRGCAYDCSFCSIGRYWSRRSRTLPAERLAREVLALQGMPGAKHAYLCHDLFGADREHALDFCARMEAAGAPVPWEARARADHLDLELLQAMKRAGGYRVLFGIESADPEVRRRNQKGMRDDLDGLALVDDCATAGIVPILSLILGLPGEDDAALARTLDFCADASLRAGVNLSLHLANPQPGCELGDLYAGESHALDGIAPDMAFGTGATAPERALIAEHPDLFSTWHLLPIGDDRLRDLSRITKLLPEVLMRYPRTFAVLREREGMDALALYRTWQADGRSFESFAQRAGDRLIDDTLAWEQAQVRAGVRGPLEGLAAAPHRVPRAVGELLRIGHDVSQLGPGALDAPAAETHLVVQPVPAALAGTRTLKITSDVARLLGTLDGATPVADLESARPGIARALEQLADAGLVTYLEP